MWPFSTKNKNGILQCLLASCLPSAQRALYVWLRNVTQQSITAESETHFLLFCHFYFLNLSKVKQKLTLISSFGTTESEQHLA